VSVDPLDGPINVGDQVRLRSGGPVLTVLSVELDDELPRCVCAWELGDGTGQVDTFQLATLEPASTPERFPWPSSFR
jgi:uncharacterized protein YodC (DUF2158 family)